MLLDSSLYGFYGFLDFMGVVFLEKRQLHWRQENTCIFWNFIRTLHSEFNSFRDRARDANYSYCEAGFCIEINVKVTVINPFHPQNP